jgi:hypothetical protein
MKVGDLVIRNSPHANPRKIGVIVKDDYKGNSVNYRRVFWFYLNSERNHSIHSLKLLSEA